MKSSILLAVALTVAVSTVACADAPADVQSGSKLPLEHLKLPAGYAIEVWARDVPGARSMTFGSRGTLFVGTRDEGKVYAIVSKDGRASRRYTIASGLTMPNGVAFKDGNLYVAEVSRILRFDRIEERLADPPKPVVVRSDYPDKKSHGWKFIAFGPDGMLYVPVGAPCNVCRITDPFASITRLAPDGSSREIFARGVRNTVGFDWDPATRELWFTDNGRDNLGNDVPPDELNRAPRAGLHFGYPFCHGGDIPDPEFGKERACSEFTPPVVKLGAHHAALGMRFYRGAMFPALRGRILIAEHGSWNRDEPAGYRVLVVDPARRTQEPLVDGWLEGSSAWGRPVDVQETADGSVLVSDDKAGAIYRVFAPQKR